MDHLIISRLLVETPRVSVRNLGLEEEWAELKRQVPGAWSQVVVGDQGLMLVRIAGGTPRACLLLKSFGRVNFIFTKVGVKERTIQAVAELSGKTEDETKKLLDSAKTDLQFPIQFRPRR